MVYGDKRGSKLLGVVHKLHNHRWGKGGGAQLPFYVNPKFQPGKIFWVHALNQKQRVDLQRAKSASKAFCAKSLMLNKFCLSNDDWALSSVLEWFP